MCLENIHCPTCGTAMTPSANFCPACSYPRPQLEERLRQEAASSGISYANLLDEARREAAAGLEIGERLDRLERQVGRLSERVRGIEVHLTRAEGRHQVTAPTRSEPELRSWTVTPQAAPPPPGCGTPQPHPPKRAVVPKPAPATPEPVRLDPQAKRPPSQTAPAVPAPEPVLTDWSFNDLERMLSGRVLAWVGGLAVLLGAIFFLSLAFSRGWIGPGARVTIGVLVSSAMVAGGAWFFARRERLFGHVLVAVGLGIFSVSMLAATRLYALVLVELGLLGALIGGITAAAIAVRAGSQVVAGYGLVAALVAPPLLGAAPTGITIAFLAVTLVGTTATALYRSWAWLPPLAFLFSAPQLVDWLTGDVASGIGLTTLTGFWLLYTLAAGGEEFRIRGDFLRPTSATLLLANAALLIWLGFVILDGDLERWRGPFLVVVALAYAALGGYFVMCEDDRHPFALLALGTGVAAVSMAVPVQLGGSPVPLAWAAEAVALTWVYTRRQHGYSGGVAVILGSLAVLHLAAFEYPLADIFRGWPSHLPFINESGGALAFLLAALAVAGYLVRKPAVRVALGGGGAILMVYALPFELSGVALISGWASLFVLGVATAQHLQTIPGFHVVATEQGQSADWARRALYLPIALTGCLAGLHAFIIELPLDALVQPAPATPFTDNKTLAAVILATAAALTGFVVTSTTHRRIAVTAAFLILAYLMPFELKPAATIVAWSVLAIAQLLVAERDRDGIGFYVSSAGFLIGIGFLVTVTALAPLERLFVDAASRIDHPLLWSNTTLALGSIIAALLVASSTFRQYRNARWLTVLAGALGVYLLSIGVVDHFQGQVRDITAVPALQKQAQVALSILWAVLGGTAFVAGIVRRGIALRACGLALLAIVTAKVFLYDLASLDTSYRVLSFIGLGVLLLASSYAYQRLMPQITQPGKS